MLEIPFCEGNRANDIVGYHVGRIKFFSAMESNTLQHL